MGNNIFAFQYIKGSYKKDGRKFLIGPFAIGKETTVLN